MKQTSWINFVKKMFSWKKKSKINTLFWTQII